MRWKQLLVKKAIVGRLPFADKLRAIKRKVFGYPPDPRNLELTIKSYGRIKANLEKHGAKIEDSTILEIGSGWFPTIPILLARDGARKVFMSDLNVHMDEITFKATLAYLKNRFKNDDYIQGITDFESLPIEYLAPFNVSRIPDNSLDAVISNTVLEHIPKTDIFNLFSSLCPKISEDGVMAHLVDHSDHFEHYDKSISRINFLTWSDEKHALINLLIKDGENRMRHHEYHQVFADSGYQLLDEEADVDNKTLELVNGLDLVYPYSKMTPKQLSVITSIYSLKRMAVMSPVGRF
ncbi:MAG TPA: class I SAM-dependent methyltransferase [Fibrobacteria bacterium]|nr:class I SAM-dependent methyltransferase [Fibrobacteria bacterium]